MFNKRIAAAIAGTALAASAIIAPQASAQTLVQNDAGVYGTLVTVDTNQGSQTVFLPNGVELIAVPGGTQKPKEYPNCFTKNGNVYTNYNFAQITHGTVDSVVDGVSYKTVGAECSAGSYIDPGNGNGGDNGDDKDGSSVGGAALLGLSALGAAGLLSSGANSSASSDESAPVTGDDSEGPATGPVAGQDAKADAQKPATGPVGGQDPKAAAQQ